MSFLLLLPAIYCSALLAWLFRFNQLPGKLPGILVFVSMALCFVPINGLAIAAYIRGVFSEPSISTVIIASLSIASLIRGKAIFSQRDYLPLLYFIPVFSLFFYPSSLGLTFFDPYSYGYQPHFLLAALLAITLLLWWKKYYLLTMIILVDLWCFNLELLSSNNLWDYLVDPMLLIYCLVQLSVFKRQKKLSRTS